MRTLALAMLLVAAGTLAAPVASACPDPDHPCDPMPYDPLPGGPCQDYGGTFGWVKHLVSCLT